MKAVPQNLRSGATEVAEAPDRLVMVGFNRRFSPHVAKMKRHGQ